MLVGARWLCEPHEDAADTDGFAGNRLWRLPFGYDLQWVWPKLVVPVLSIEGVCRGVNKSSCASRDFAIVENSERVLRWDVWIVWVVLEECAGALFERGSEVFGAGARVISRVTGYACDDFFSIPLLALMLADRDGTAAGVINSRDGVIGALHDFVDVCGALSGVVGVASEAVGGDQESFEEWDQQDKRALEHFVSLWVLFSFFSVLEGTFRERTCAVRILSEVMRLCHARVALFRRGRYR